MNRREFSQAFFAVGVVLTLPFRWVYGKIQHRLYGDGATDDTAAIQALLDGEPVIGPDGKPIIPKLINGTMVVTLPGAIYRVTRKG